MAASSAARELEGRSITVSQTFDAPRALVFEAWSKPEHLSRWFGPNGYTIHDVVMDFRVGGTCSLLMRAPDGTGFPSEATYREIVRNEKIVLESDARDGNDTLLFSTQTIATFREEKGRTTLTVVSRVIKAYDTALTAPAIAGMEEGWRQTIGRLVHVVTDLTRR